MAQAFSAWIHICAVRLFVESILRYGLPPQFLSALMKPVVKTSVKLRKVLAMTFGGSSACSAPENLLFKSPSTMLSRLFALSRDFFVFRRGGFINTTSSRYGCVTVIERARHERALEEIWCCAYGYQSTHPQIGSSYLAESRSFAFEHLRSPCHEVVLCAGGSHFDTDGGGADGEMYPYVSFTIAID